MLSVSIKLLLGGRSSLILQLITTIDDCSWKERVILIITWNRCKSIVLNPVCQMSWSILKRCFDMILKTDLKYLTRLISIIIHTICFRKRRQRQRLRERVHWCEERWVYWRRQEVMVGPYPMTAVAVINARDEWHRFFIIYDKEKEKEKTVVSYIQTHVLLFCLKRY